MQVHNNTDVLVTKAQLFLVFIFIVTILGCSIDPENPDTQQCDERNSAIAVFVHSGDAVERFLDSPAKSYVQAWFSFPADLADDVYFGVDHEFYESMNDYSHFEGAAWMGYVAITRNGILGFPYGTQAQLDGEASGAEIWEVMDLGITLQPGTWYLIKCEADFGERTFLTFHIEGPGIDETVDISGYALDYPNYVPVEKRSLTYYVHAVRSTPEPVPGTSGVYADDVEAGIETAEGWKIVFQDGFENQTAIADTPLKPPFIIDLESITEKYWYLENPNTLATIGTAYPRSGAYSCMCDASLALPCDRER